MIQTMMKGGAREIMSEVSWPAHPGHLYIGVQGSGAPYGFICRTKSMFDALKQDARDVTIQMRWFDAPEEELDPNKEAKGEQ
jgi:hypothetical protein